MRFLKILFHFWSMGCYLDICHFYCTMCQDLCAGQVIGSYRWISCCLRSHRCHQNVTSRFVCDYIFSHPAHEQVLNTSKTWQIYWFSKMMYRAIKQNRKWKIIMVVELFFFPLCLSVVVFHSCQAGDICFCPSGPCFFAPLLGFQRQLSTVRMWCLLVSRRSGSVHRAYLGVVWPSCPCSVPNKHQGSNAKMVPMATSHG